MQNTPINSGAMDSHIDDTAGEGCAIDLLMFLVFANAYIRCKYTYNNACNQETDTCHKAQNIQCP